MKLFNAALLVLAIVYTAKAAPVDDVNLQETDETNRAVTTKDDQGETSSGAVVPDANQKLPQNVEDWIKGRGNVDDFSELMTSEYASEKLNEERDFASSLAKEYKLYNLEKFLEGFLDHVDIESEKAYTIISQIHKYMLAHFTSKKDKTNDKIAKYAVKKLNKLATFWASNEELLDKLFPGKKPAEGWKEGAINTIYKKLVEWRDEGFDPKEFDFSLSSLNEESAENPSEDMKPPLESIETIHSPSFQFKNWLQSQHAQQFIEQELSTVPLGEFGSLALNGHGDDDKEAIKGCVEPSDVDPSDSFEVTGESFEVVMSYSINNSCEAIDDKEPLHYVATFEEAVLEVFNAETNGGHLSRGNFDILLSYCGLPIFLSSSLWRYMTEEWVEQPNGLWINVQSKRLDHGRFLRKWNALEQKARRRNPSSLILKNHNVSYVDEHALIFEILRGTHPLLKTLGGESFELLAEDIVEYHPELSFIKGNTHFCAKYYETCVIRIFYSILRSPPPLDIDIIEGRTTGISLQQFKHSNFVEVIKNLVCMEINDEIHYFSYKHFYVFFCKFFDSDSKKLNTIDFGDLMRYDGGSLSTKALERILSGYGLSHRWRECKEGGKFLLDPYYYKVNSVRKVQTPDSGISLHDDDLSDYEDAKTMDLTTNAKSPPRYQGYLTYTDFIWFVLSEEDRSSPTAIEYWFRITDLDGDGLISLFELEEFFKYQEEHLQKELCLIEFKDAACIALDIINGYDEEDISPRSDTEKTDKEFKVALTCLDLKKKPLLAFRFFDYFLNWKKLLERESTNGNRLLREIDDVQQGMYTIARFGVSSVLELENFKDNKNPFARWADNEYEKYIVHEEQERFKKRAQREKQIVARQYGNKLRVRRLASSILRKKGSYMRSSTSYSNQKRQPLSEFYEEEDDDEDFEHMYFDYDAENIEDEELDLDIGDVEDYECHENATSCRRMAVVSAHNIDNFHVAFSDVVDDNPDFDLDEGFTDPDEDPTYDESFKPKFMSAQKLYADLKRTTAELESIKGLISRWDELDMNDKELVSEAFSPSLKMSPVKTEPWGTLSYEVSPTRRRNIFDFTPPTTIQEEDENGLALD